MAPATAGLEEYFQYCDIVVVNESEVTKYHFLCKS